MYMAPPSSLFSFLYQFISFSTSAPLLSHFWEEQDLDTCAQSSILNLETMELSLNAFVSPNTPCFYTITHQSCTEEQDPSKWPTFPSNFCFSFEMHYRSLPKRWMWLRRICSWVQQKAFLCDVPHIFHIKYRITHLCGPRIHYLFHS